MNTQHTPTVKEFQKLTLNYLDTLKPDPYNEENSRFEVEFTGGYFELALKAKSLIAVCQSALISQEVNSDYHNNIDLTTVLEMAKQMIPLNEAEYLDKMRGYFEKEEKKQ